MIIFPGARLHGRDEVGRILMILVVRRLTVDAYWWPSRRLKVWSVPAVGVLLDMRLGWFECQVRWR